MLIHIYCSRGAKVEYAASDEGKLSGKVYANANRSDMWKHFGWRNDKGQKVTVRQKTICRHRRALTDKLEHPYTAFFAHIVMLKMHLLFMKYIRQHFFKDVIFLFWNIAINIIFRILISLHP